MHIVSQSAPFSLTLFPPNMPLLLSAPKIAGLLPANVPSSSATAASDTFTHRNPALANLSDPTREKLFEAVGALLDLAAACLTHDPTDLDDMAFIVAEADLRRAVFGVRTMPRRAQQKRADHYANVREYLAGSADRMAAREAELQADMAEMDMLRTRRARCPQLPREVQDA